MNPHDNVVNAAWQRRRQQILARKAFLSSSVIVVVLFLIYFDINTKAVSRSLGFDSQVFVFEICVAALLVMKMSLDIIILIRYLWTSMFEGPLNLTEQQRSLLAIQDNEYGFRTPPPQQLTISQSSENSLIFSSPHGSFSSGEGSSLNLMRSLSFSPGYISTSSPFPTKRHHRAPTNSSPSYGSPRSHSFDRHYQTFSTSTPSDSFISFDGNKSGMRSRHSYTKPRSASSSPYERITDLNKLKSFIEEEEEKELRSKQSAVESHNTSLSFWSFGASPLDLTYPLRKYAYQLATPSPQATTKAMASDQASLSGFDEVWSNYEVTEDDVNVWIEKLRKWLSSTIVSQLSKQIVEINKQLQMIGCEDMKIGETGLATVRQLALSKGNMVPYLKDVVPYLECCPNQEYLVRRISDLSTGSMSEYTWNKGGNYKKPWDEQLITDAGLVMHLLCTYMDSCLPAQPRFLDRRVFTAQHFVKTPEKPGSKHKANITRHAPVAPIDSFMTKSVNSSTRYSTLKSYLQARAHQQLIRTGHPKALYKFAQLMFCELNCCG